MLKLILVSLNRRWLIRRCVGCDSRLYTNGVNLNSLALYPPVKLPVSSSTTWLSPLVRWDHSDSWEVPAGIEYASGGSGSGSAVTVEVNMASPDSKDAYLSGHVLDGRTLFPATGYLVLAWKQLAKMHGKTCEETPVSFDDVHIYRATILPASGKSGQSDYSIDESILLHVSFTWNITK